MTALAQAAPAACMRTTPWQPGPGSAHAMVTGVTGWGMPAWLLWRAPRKQQPGQAPGPNPDALAGDKELGAAGAVDNWRRCA